MEKKSWQVARYFLFLYSFRFSLATAGSLREVDNKDFGLVGWLIASPGFASHQVVF